MLHPSPIASEASRLKGDDCITKKAGRDNPARVQLSLSLSRFAETYFFANCVPAGTGVQPLLGSIFVRATTGVA